MKTDLQHSSVRAIALLCAVALSLAAAPVQARNQDARAKFERAQRAYHVGSFEEALALYEEAYRLDPRPPFLFNIGQCHRQMGNWERAICFFNQYLDAHAKTKKAPPKNHALVVDLIRECVREQTAKEAAEREAAAKAEQEREAAAKAEQARAAAERELQAQQQQPSAPSVRAVEAFAADTPVALDLTVRASAAVESAPPPADAAVNAEPPVWRRWWFWTAVGAVAAGAVAGGVWVATAPEPQPTTLGTRDLR